MFKHLSFIFLIAILIQACSPTDDDLVCTEEFVQILVEVVDSSGEPVEKVQIQIAEEETGTLYPCDDQLCDEFTKGSYIIMHDGSHGEISETGETFIIEGSKDGLGFSEQFTFRSGACHIEKMLGPETVVLTEI